MADPKVCIEPGCDEPAGTPWTPLWCSGHDEERRARITESFERIDASFKAAEEETDADRNER